MNAAEDLAAEAEAALRKARRHTDAAGGKPSASGASARKRHQASSYKPKCPGCGSFDHVYKDCFYRSHPYFNKDPSIEYARSPVWIRYYNTIGGRYIKECDLDPTLPKNDRGGSINENVPGWTILLDFRANLWAAGGRYRAAEISAAKLTNPSGTSRHNN